MKLATFKQEALPWTWASDGGDPFFEERVAEGEETEIFPTDIIYGSYGE